MCFDCDPFFESNFEMGYIHCFGGSQIQMTILFFIAHSIVGIRIVVFRLDCDAMIYLLRCSILHIWFTLVADHPNIIEPQYVKIDIIMAL